MSLSCLNEFQAAISQPLYIFPHSFVHNLVYSFEENICQFFPINSIQLCKGSHFTWKLSTLQSASVCQLIQFRYHYHINVYRCIKFVILYLFQFHPSYFQLMVLECMQIFVCVVTNLQHVSPPYVPQCTMCSLIISYIFYLQQFLLVATTLDGFLCYMIHRWIKL